MSTVQYRVPGAMVERLMASTQSLDSVRLRRITLCLIPLVVALCAYLIWSAPYRTMQAFLRAVERRDADAMIALAHPLEKDAQLTPANVRYLLDRVMPRSVRRNGSAVPTAGRGTSWRGAAQVTALYSGTLCRWTVKWADARTGSPIPGLGPGGELTTDVFVKPSGWGWRILVSQFLWDACRSKWGYRPGSQAFCAIGQQAGLTGRIDVYGRLRTLDLVQGSP